MKTNRIRGLASAVILVIAISCGSARAEMTVAELPVGSSPAPVAANHFPDPLHAFVWRNWQLVRAERMAEVVGAGAAQIIALGHAMGLQDPPEITDDQVSRSYISVIKRNWHLIPYEQLLALLDWTPDELHFTLLEDDFLLIKLGMLKPKCEPIHWSEPDEVAKKREAEIARVVREAFPEGTGLTREPLFDFVRQLSEPVSAEELSINMNRKPDRMSPRYCYSYFAPYGDPLIDPSIEPYPDGLLQRLSIAGADGVWLQGVLYKLAPFPWDAKKSEGWETRLENLEKMAARAKKQGIGIWIYMNEPRAMPPSFFNDKPELKGVEAGGLATICTSRADVQDWMKRSIALICERAPSIAGFFTITASENVTNCWSHGKGAECPRCAPRGPAVVIAEVNALIQIGIEAAKGNQKLIAWDWGWNDAWAPQAIELLPQSVAQMSVSEWSLPIERGGIKGVVGEYSISSIGPGPRATKHWEHARARGLKTMAKIQAGITWELAAVPYVPAMENVARHVKGIMDLKTATDGKSGADGFMLGWTLGGYPSPNLEIVREMQSNPAEPHEILERVARARFGEAMSPHVVRAWETFSKAFSEYPYDIGVAYNGPQHNGPANPLWEKPTGYTATMVGFPYDHLAMWRATYPEDVFIGQMEKVADGFDAGLKDLTSVAGEKASAAKTEHDRNFASELRGAEACAIHFRSVANQARFVRARNKVEAGERGETLDEIERVLHAEIDLAQRMHGLQIRDSRFGFEASNHYYYVPVDLAEKVINCSDLLARWLPQLRTK